MSTAVSKVLTKIFGSRNDRLLKRYRRIVDQVNELAPKIESQSDEQLRSAGLSSAKSRYIRDLAAKVSDGTVPLRQLKRLPDDEVIGALTEVNGIGIDFIISISFG